MIRPHRHHHRIIFIALGFLLPIVFALGIVARKPFPSMDASPDGWFATPQKFTVAGWSRTDLFVKSPIRVSLRRENINGGALAVEFSATRDYFIKPDLMAYWAAGNPSITNQLPDNACLLGGFDSGALPLPAAAATHRGVLVLYSLADNKIVEVSKPVQFDPSTK
jgi:hypothetical protein